MAERIKALLCKPKTWTSDPQDPWKCHVGMVACLETQEGRDRKSLQQTG